MLVVLNVTTCGDIEGVVKGREIVQVQGRTSLVTSAGATAGVIQPGGDLPFFAHLAGETDVSLTILLSRLELHMCGRSRKALEIGHPLFQIGKFQHVAFRKGKGIP
ncbi:hypothetical protein D3C75_1215480 [compost metagenome]